MPSKRTFSIKTTGFCLVAVLTFLLLLLPQDVQANHNSNKEFHFTILHTNDMHSALIPHSPAIDYHPEVENSAIGGFARLATAINEIRQKKTAQNEPVLLFDAGDFLGGAAFAWLSTLERAPEISLMQEMGYDAVIIGNHEYDYGPDVLAKYLISAGYPEAHSQTMVLASNTRAPQDHLLAEQQLYKDIQTIELHNGIKIGIFSLIGKDAISVTADTGDIEFLDQHTTALDSVKRLKEQSVDIVIAITHSGIDEDRELAREVSGIDIIIGGHSHTELFEPVIESGTVIAHAGSLGKYLGQLELAYDADSKTLRIRNGENGNPALVAIDNNFSPDLHIDELVTGYTQMLNEHIKELTGGVFGNLMQVVAISDFSLENHPPLTETSVANFITDAMRIVTQEVTGNRVDIAIQANGSIRQSISPGSMEYSHGQISFYEVVETIGLGYGEDGFAGYPVVSVYLTGEEVRRLLEVAVLLQELMGDTYFLQFSGLRYDYNPTNAVLFTVPFLDLPIPTTRSVVDAELYTGDGIQPLNGDGYIPVKAGDDTLYHLVADTYILSYLPMVGDMLPNLEILPKNAAGEHVPLERHSELVVNHPDGRELKVWETVVTYAASLPANNEELPRIATYYEDTAGRINQVWTFPLVAWVWLTLALIIAVIVLLVNRRRPSRETI